MFMYTYIDAHLMLLQTVPAACVLGSSWADWRRIFAQTKYVILFKLLNSSHVWLCKVSTYLGPSVSYLQLHYCNPCTTFRPKGSIEYLICLPAHGAVIGGWFGAWPMPLDWERPWQVISLFWSIVLEFIDNCFVKSQSRQEEQFLPELHSSTTSVHNLLTNSIIVFVFVFAFIIPLQLV